MGLFDWIQSNMDKLKWYDISLVKTSTFFFTLFLVVVWQGFREFILGFEWYWYLIIALAATIIPLKRMFSE